MRTSKRIILDTDPGIDDALAIILSLRSKELKVEAITTVSGNVPVRLGTRNVRRILRLMGLKDLPMIAEGSSLPIKEPPLWTYEIHGKNGLGDLDCFFNDDSELDEDWIVSRKAIDLIFEMIEKYPNEIIIVTLGPLTNIACAIEKDKDKMDKVQGIIMMGGAVDVKGNITPDAEFNIFFDPHAAKIVFDSGIPVIMVGLNVTRKCILRKEELVRITEGKREKIEEFILGATDRYMEIHLKKTGRAYCYLHDPLAVGVAIDPTLVKMHKMDIDVCIDKKRGKTFCKKKDFQSEIQVCTDVDSKRFLRLFYERVFES